MLKMLAISEQIILASKFMVKSNKFELSFDIAIKNKKNQWTNGKPRYGENQTYTETCSFKKTVQFWR